MPRMPSIQIDGEVNIHLEHLGSGHITRDGIEYLRRNRMLVLSIPQITAYCIILNHDLNKIAPEWFKAYP